MVVSFVLYVGFIWIKYGIQKSISDSYYRLPEDDKSLFTLFCWWFAVPAIILGDNLLMFLAGSGIVFVGAAAAFKQNEMQHWVHLVGAYSAILLSQIAIWVKYDLLYVNIIFVVSSVILLFLNVKNKIWWIEILAFTTICLALLINN
jgi:hypothetical protein